MSSEQRLTWGDHPVPIFLGAVAAVVTILTFVLGVFQITADGQGTRQAVSTVPDAGSSAPTVASSPSLPSLTSTVVTPTAVTEPPSVTVAASVPSPAPTSSGASPSGSWLGQWVEDVRGDTYRFSLVLDVAGQTASGRFEWTVAKTSVARERPGMRAVEAVQGVWDASTRTLHLQGRVVDDPDGFLTADSYTLALSADGQVISGATRTTVAGEPWIGSIRGTRA